MVRKARESRPRSGREICNVCRSPGKILPKVMGAYKNTIGCSIYEVAHIFSYKHEGVQFYISYPHGSLCPLFFRFCRALPRKSHNLPLTQWDNVYQSGDLGGQLQMKVQITQVTRHENEPNILYLPPRAPRSRESPKRKIHIVALG